ncbi:MAG: hypothetical protein ABEN55_11530 [Bradymonadaceae bacterium]
MMRRLSGCLWGLALITVFAVGCSDDPDDGNGADADSGPLPDAADTEIPDGDIAGGDADTTGADGDAETGLDGGDADGQGGDIGDTTAGDADAAGDTSQPPCRSDGQCPGNAVCEMGDCRFYRFVQIRDLTRDKSSQADTACGEDSAGSDLFQLELRGPFGRVLGYGQATAAKLKATANTDAGNVFDGVANSLEDNDGALCPSGGFGADSVVSMGCGGAMVVGFFDGAGNIVNLATGQRLVVHEYGDQCCSQDCPEEYYQIRICNAQSPNKFQQGMVDDQGNYPTCDTAIVGSGSARSRITLQMPRPSN